ncbi:MAG: hypothetical protein PHX04_00145 [Bacilli bacterium]|nr:hypothetical protein [Bacilli bacterium]
MILTNNELTNLYGGASISGTLLNAIAKLITTVFNIGKAIGSAISMSKRGTRC